MVSACSRVFKTGQVVRAFYDMNTHPLKYRYVRLLEESDPATPEETKAPSMISGLSTGWIRGIVEEDYPSTATPDPNLSEADRNKVLVKLHGDFADVYNTDKATGMFWRVPPELVVSVSEPLPPLQLSLLVIRWYNYFSRVGSTERNTHSVLNEGMLRDVLEGPQGPHGVFGATGAYEVYTVFVRGTEHVQELNVKAIHETMRAKRKAALYFLWPTQRTSERSKPGMIEEPALFDLIRRAEAAGIRSCWPHPPDLYHLLAGKKWVSELGTRCAELRVPRTVAVLQRDWAKDPVASAEAALKKLQDLQGAQGPAESFRGVCKLGFTWMGEGVQPFIGVKSQNGLEESLRTLLEEALPGAECFVQERIENVKCEIRAFCCKDPATGPDAYVVELVKMKLKKPPRHMEDADPTFRLTSGISLSDEEMAEEAFGGDRRVLEAAASEARALANKWLAWFKESPRGAPHVCRLDFLVSWNGTGDAELHTIELTECGGSTCDLKVNARTAATLNECLADPAQPRVDGFPRPLPPLVREPPPSVAPLPCRRPPQPPSRPERIVRAAGGKGGGKGGQDSRRGSPARGRAIEVAGVQRRQEAEPISRMTTLSTLMVPCLAFRSLQFLLGKRQRGWWLYAWLHICGAALSLAFARRQHWQMTQGASEIVPATPERQFLRPQRSGPDRGL